MIMNINLWTLDAHELLNDHQRLQVVRKMRGHHRAHLVHRPMQHAAEWRDQRNFGGSRGGGTFSNAFKRPTLGQFLRRA